MLTKDRSIKSGFENSGFKFKRNNFTILTEKKDTLEPLADKNLTDNQMSRLMTDLDRNCILLIQNCFL
jgi:hypothetical protein